MQFLAAVPGVSPSGLQNLKYSTIDFVMVSNFKMGTLPSVRVVTSIPDCKTHKAIVEDISTGTTNPN